MNAKVLLLSREGASASFFINKNMRHRLKQPEKQSISVPQADHNTFNNYATNLDHRSDLLEAVELDEASSESMINEVSAQSPQLLRAPSIQKGFREFRELHFTDLCPSPT